MTAEKTNRVACSLFPVSTAVAKRFSGLKRNEPNGLQIGQREVNMRKGH